MNNYFFQTITLLFVYTTQIYCDSTNTETLISTATSPSYSTSIATLTQTSNGLHETSTVSFIDTSRVINTSTQKTSIAITTATERFTSASISSDSSLVTTQQIYATANLIYKYTVQSSTALKLGNITNSTVLEDVQSIVDASFNQSGFTITVKRVEIKSQAKTFDYEMFTENAFESNRSDCNITCMKNTLLSSIPNENLTLPATDGTPVSVTVRSAASLVENTSSGTTIATTARVNYQKGESPPGVAARLGMGLGITIFALIVIVEIVYLRRKYGNNNPMRQSNYEFPSYHQHHRLSVE